MMCVCGCVWYVCVMHAFVPFLFRANRVEPRQSPFSIAPAVDEMIPEALM